MKLRSGSATLLAAMILSAASLAGQSALAVSDAADFMGTWTVTLQGAQGTAEHTLSLTDKGGKVAGEFTGPLAPAPPAVDDIKKEGNDLVLKYVGAFQGNTFDATLRLTLDGANKANAILDIANGQIQLSGPAVKK